MRNIYWALILIGIGIWILLSNYGIVVFNFSKDWPVILIVIGIVEVLDVIFHVSAKKRKFHAKSKNDITDVLKSLENGDITVEEAEDSIRGGKNG